MGNKRHPEQTNETAKFGNQGQGLILKSNQHENKIKQNKAK
jgi:hypothetical protein